MRTSVTVARFGGGPRGSSGRRTRTTWFRGLFVDLLQRGETDVDFPYLYRAVTNRCLSLLRDESNRARLLAQDADALAPRTACDERVIGRDLLVKLVRALDASHCEVLFCRYLDDMTQEEIATLLGLSRKTIGKRLERIREAVGQVAPDRGEGRDAMSGARCIDVPISWLRLERYHLGEVASDERGRIEEHLAACPACALCYARIEQDEAVALPPLPAVVRPGGARRARVLAFGGGAVALAAALALAIGGAWRGHDDARSRVGGRAAVKGDAIAFSLVREDDERIEGATGIFRGGDRFKALVTCPPSMTEVPFELVVYDEAGEASFPLSAARLACGNDVPLPGAFRLTGRGEVTVCVAWGIEREALAARRAEGDGVLCKRLRGAAEDAKDAK